jgi:hypothetical protein
LFSIGFGVWWPIETGSHSSDSTMKELRLIF